MERGKSKDPGKQERLDNYKAQFKNGKKKWVRYDEGAILYSMGIHSFMDLANEAKAVYRIKRICLAASFVAVRNMTGMNRKEFAEWLAIPYRTMQDWELGTSQVPEYVLRLVAYKVLMEKERGNL